MELNEQVTLLMEPKPADISAKDLREKERMTEWYSCDDAYSPNGWWKAQIGTDHNRDEYGTFRVERDDAPVRWIPARNPAEDITDAWEVAGRLKAFSISRDIHGRWHAWAWKKTHFGVTDESAPLAICRLAVEIEEHSKALTLSNR